MKTYQAPALYHEFVEPTFAVQDAVLEFIYKTFGDSPYDETSESAQTLNERLKWQEKPAQKHYAEAWTFEWAGQSFLVIKINYTSQSSVGIYREAARCKVYQALANKFVQFKAGYIQEQELNEFCRKYLPHGSGFDNGVRVNLVKSKSNKIVLDVPFHPMDENGMYMEWVRYTCTIVPDFAFGFDLDIKGPYKNGLRTYIDDTLYQALSKTRP